MTGTGNAGPSRTCNIESHAFLPWGYVTTSLLPAPLTKVEGQTLRIEYEITWGGATGNQNTWASQNWTGSA